MAKKKQIKEKTYTAGELADFVLDMAPELQEAFTRADIELALDDRGWLSPGVRNYIEFDDTSRTKYVNMSRLYWMKDPLCKQAVRLWTDYALGNGMSYNSEDSSVQTQLEAFCKNRANKKIMSSKGQRKSSKKQLVDGEIFFAIFTDGDVPTIRRVDPLQVTRFIKDPDDDETVLAYRRETKDQKRMYYMAWDLDEDQQATLKAMKDPDFGTMIWPKTVKDAVMYYADFDSLGDRGTGLLFPVVDWSREHRRFMEARVAITQALAKFAWKGKVKGGQQKLNQIKQRVESTYAQTRDTIERHPVPAPGATWWENDGIDLSATSRSTGSGDAKSDGDMQKLMVCAGTNIMLHYFGDPSTGNLATATAMELPMLKAFQAYQQQWIDIYRDIFSIALGEDIDEEPAEIDIDYPPILDADLQSLATFISSATAVFPEMKVEQVLTVLLRSMNIDNVGEVMDAIRTKREELDAQAVQDQKNQLALATAVGQNPKQAQALKESYDKLADAMLKLASVQE